MEAPSSVPPDAEVLRQLERILANPFFQTSPRLSAFLRYAVESALAGRVEQLKEYVIGVEVLGRGISYSPQEDPAVRVMAGRLRSRLAEYYQGDGRSDGVIIELPRGGYVPRYVWRKQPAGAQTAEAVQERELSGSVRSDSVGRDEELTRLHAAFAVVSASSGDAFTITGGAGLGKTTVAEDFLSELERQSPAAWVGRGRCSERLAETDAFAPILESLDRLMRGDCGHEVAQVMKATAPTWYRQVAPLAGQSAETPGKKPIATSHERMRREFVAFFEELSRARVVVLFFDDLHWADASTCDLLAYLGMRIRNMRLLILMTYRPTGVLPRTDLFLPLKLDLERRGLCQQLSLSVLDLKDVERYIATRFPANLFPVEFVAAVHERTEGNPLFMTDMLRFLRDRQVLLERDGRWVLDQPVSEVRKLIPTGIQSMIRLKIDQLSKDDHDVLFCAAVQGVQFDSAVIARVLSRDPVEVEERLQELERAHDLVSVVGEREFPDHTFSVQYRFVHVFYQNALYGALAPSRRAAQSLAVARALLEFTGHASSAAAADLAVLFESGRDYANASLYFLHAARSAARVFAYPEAVILCERGLRALTSLPESRERDAQELLFSLTLGIALMATRGYAVPEVKKTHQRSRELCLKLNETRRLLSALWGLHTCEVIGANLVGALQVAKEMRQAADELEDPTSIVESLHALGTTLVFMGRLTEAREPLERIFAAYPVSQHIIHSSLYVLDPRVTSLSILARLLVFMGYLDQAIDKANASVALARRLAHPQSVAYATLWVGFNYHARGEYAESYPHLESAMELSRQHKLPQILEWGRIILGSSLTRIGRATEGISEMRKSIGRQKAMNSLNERALCLTLLAEALAAENACEEALGLCDEALVLSQCTEGRCYDPETHRIRGEVLIALGDVSRLPEAEAEFRCALQLARQAQCRLLELRTAMSYFRLRRELGDSAGGRSVLTDVLAGFTNESTAKIVNAARMLLDD